MKVEKKKSIQRMAMVLLVFLAWGLAGCTPNIYFIDRHTIMEEEASGEWPQVEREFGSKTPKKGVTFFTKEPMNEKKQAVYRVLNGEYVSKK